MGRPGVNSQATGRLIKEIKMSFIITNEEKFQVILELEAAIQTIETVRRITRLVEEEYGIALEGGALFNLTCVQNFMKKKQREFIRDLDIDIIEGPV